MLRDNLVGLIEPMLKSAGAYPLALGTARKQSSDDRPPCLENPRPEGAESTLTENAASPFQAEPRQPREVFGKFPPLKGAPSKRKKVMAKGLRFLEGPGVYILYRDDEPYYIGRA